MKRPHEQPISTSADDARLRPHLRERDRSERRARIDHQAHVLREAVRQSPDAVAPRRTGSAAIAEPGDLRGIPVIGRGVGGAIPGTNPENTTVRRNP